MTNITTVIERKLSLILFLSESWDEFVRLSDKYLELCLELYDISESQFYKIRNRML